MRRAWWLGLMGFMLACGMIGCGDDSADDGGAENNAGNNAANNAANNAGNNATNNATNNAGNNATNNTGNNATNNAGNNATNNAGNNAANNASNNAANNTDNNANNNANNVNNGDLEVACPVDGCGGEVVGVWNWESWCRTIPPEDMVLPECPEAVIGQEIVPQGTLTFGDDGRYEVAATYEISSSLLLPLACLQGGTCDDLLASLNQDEAEFLWTCATEGEACACERVQSLDGSQAGTYETQGGILTTYPEGEDGPRPLVYCVEGDELQARDRGAQVTDPTFFLTRAQ